MFQRQFVTDTAVRMVRTFAQTLASVLGGSALNVWTAGWHSALGVAAGSAVLSLLMSLDRLSVTAKGDIVVEEFLPAQPASGPVSEVVGCGDNLR